MRKVIAAMNMTIDGFCDHTAGIADDELHEHYEALIRNAGILLYGRITYQLMEYWRTVLEHPEGNKSDYDFAVAMDKAPKLVFSHTLKSTDWETASIAKGSLEEEVLKLKNQTGKDILVGSPSLIVALTKLGLIDEYQLCIHPVVIGKGLPLFKDISERTVLTLLKTKIFKSGAVTLYYQAENK